MDRSKIIVVPSALGTFALPHEDALAALRLATDLGFTPSSAQNISPSPTPEPWINVQELSKLTKIGSTTLEGWAREGHVPCIRAGKALRFKFSEVEAALRRSGAA